MANIYAQLKDEELEKIVNESRSENWSEVRCVYCGKTISIFDADFYSGDPACKNRSCDYYG